MYGTHVYAQKVRLVAYGTRSCTDLRVQIKTALRVSQQKIIRYVQRGRVVRSGIRKECCSAPLQQTSRQRGLLSCRYLKLN